MPCDCKCNKSKSKKIKLCPPNIEGKWCDNFYFLQQESPEQKVKPSDKQQGEPVIFDIKQDGLFITYIVPASNFNDQARTRLGIWKPFYDITGKLIAWTLSVANSNSNEVSTLQVSKFDACGNAIELIETSTTSGFDHCNENQKQAVVVNFLNRIK